MVEVSFRFPSYYTMLRYSSPAASVALEVHTSLFTTPLAPISLHILPTRIRCQINSLRTPYLLNFICSFVILIYLSVLKSRQNLVINKLRRVERIPLKVQISFLFSRSRDVLAARPPRGLCGGLTSPYSYQIGGFCSQAQTPPGPSLFS